MALLNEILGSDRPIRDTLPRGGVAGGALLLIRCGAILWIGAIVGCRGPASPGERSGPVAAAPLGPDAALAERLAGIDVLHVDLWASGDRAARIEGVPMEVRPADRMGAGTGVSGPGPHADAYRIAGRPVRLSFSHEPENEVHGEQGLPRVVVELTWLAEEDHGDGTSTSPVSAVDLLKRFDPADRATLVFHGHGGRPRDFGLAPLAYHAASLAELALESQAARSAAIPAGAPFVKPLRSSDPADSPALDPFLRFCESELLVRRPPWGQGHVGAPASAWFGDVVAIDPGPDGVVLRSLPGLMHELFLGALPENVTRDEAETLHTPSLDDEWAVPRLLLLREMMGEDVFRAFLRSFVDANRGDAAMTWEDFAEAAEGAAPGLGGRFVRAWLRNSSEPRVKTRWRYDEARGRVLLRVDQVHELRGAAVAPAFPFRLPVRITDADGMAVDQVLEIKKRRDLLEVLAPTLPARFDVDPEGSLVPLMSLIASDPEDPAAK